MVVIKKSKSHPDLLVYASPRWEEGRVIKAIDDYDSYSNTSESSLEFTMDAKGDKYHQQQQQPNQYTYPKATQLELTFVKLLLADMLSVNATDDDLQKVKDTNMDILSWISLEDLRLCHQALIEEQQQQPHATQLELSFIGSLLEEELNVSVNATDDDLQKVKETHGDILSWISLEDLRICHQTLVKEQQKQPHATQLELSFIASLLEEELDVSDDDLQTVKETHGDILSWISLEDLRLCHQTLVKEQQQQPHATQLELSFIGSLLEEELDVSDDDLQTVKETHGDILSWISLKDLRLCHQTLVKEQHQQMATQLELSFIGSLLEEELKLSVAATDDKLRTVKETHGDILSWISLEDLRLCLPQ